MAMAPDLSVEDLREWSSQLERQGIDSITGRVIVDLSYFESSFYRQDGLGTT